MTVATELDPRLLEWATERQKEYIQAVRLTGGIRSAARQLGIDHALIHRAIKAVQLKAAKAAYAPDHGLTEPAAPGQRLKGSSTLYKLDTVTGQRVERLQWVKTDREEETYEALVARCEERLHDFPRFKPVDAPPPRISNLTNFLGLFDLHIGEKISSDTPAGRWDIAIARQTITASIAHAINNAPKARRMILCFGGDAAHYDGLLPVTPKSKHVLHSDGDFDDMVDAVLDVAAFGIDLALQTHEEVYLIWAEGNHDEASSVFMRKMLARIYENEPRLTVVQSKVPYYALQFGQVMIGVHHGHKAKLTRYAGIFANMFRKMWGETTYAYAHRGHEHHIHEKEQDGMIATQHPSLAPSDDYALGMGLVSRRGCMLVTYHDDYGEVARNTTRPEMLAA